VFEIDKGIGRPEFLFQLLARDQLARTLQQDRQDRNRLPLQPDANSVLAQISATGLELVEPETQNTRVDAARCHSQCPSFRSSIPFPEDTDK
jgi:hypothetical protein